MPRLTPATELQIVQCYMEASDVRPNALRSVSEVATITGFSAPTVTKVLHSRGIPLHGGPTANNRPGRAAKFTRVRAAEGKGGWVWKATYKGKKIALIEARVMAAHMLGRALADNEYVHYRDGDPYNTDEANLYVDGNPRPVHDGATRSCSRCNQDRPWPTAYSGVGTVCQECRKLAQYQSKVAAKYGLTLEQVADLGACCWICGVDRCTTGRRLAIDHDHSSNKVRGLLCHACNVGLGYFKDDPGVLEKAAAYLRATRRLESLSTPV